MLHGSVFFVSRPLPINFSENNLATQNSKPLGVSRRFDVAATGLEKSRENGFEKKIGRD